MSKANIKETVAARQAAQKLAVLEQLRRIPVIEVACERAKVSRPTLYRLRSEDESFKSAVEEAIAEGVAFISDLGEAQLITMMKEKNFAAIAFWLKTHSPRYAAKLKIEGRITHEAKELSPADKRLIEEAIRAAMPKDKGSEKIPDETLQ